MVTLKSSTNWLLKTACQRPRNRWWGDTWTVCGSPYKTSLVSTPSGRFLKPTRVHNSRNQQTKSNTRSTPRGDQNSQGVCPFKNLILILNLCKARAPIPTSIVSDVGIPVIERPIVKSFQVKQVKEPIFFIPHARLQNKFARLLFIVVVARMWYQRMQLRSFS